MILVVWALACGGPPPTAPPDTDVAVDSDSDVAADTADTADTDTAVAPPVYDRSRFDDARVFALDPTLVDPAFDGPGSGTVWMLRTPIDADTTDLELLAEVRDVEDEIFDVTLEVGALGVTLQDVRHTLRPVGDGLWATKGVLRLEADQDAALRGGAMYVRVATRARRGGVLRAQLFKPGVSYAVADLTTEHVPDPTAADGGVARAFVVYDPARENASFAVRVRGLEPTIVALTMGDVTEPTADGFRVELPAPEGPDRGVWLAPDYQLGFVEFREALLAGGTFAIVYTEEAPADAQGGVLRAPIVLGPPVE